MDNKRFLILALLFFIFALIWNGLAGIVDATNSPILNRFSTISTIALTMPANGGVNSRIAKIGRSAGKLKQGHILVTDTGTETRGGGSTIMDVAPDGSASVFSRITHDTIRGACPGGLGESTGMVVLRDGWVIVGFMPEDSGGPALVQGGCLVVLDNTGRPVETFSGSLIKGPWEIVAYENDYDAKLFVSNLLNRSASPDGRTTTEGNVVRLNVNIPVNGIPAITSMTVVASGFSENTDPEEAANGPTGLGLSPRCSAGDEDNCPDPGDRREQLLYVVDSGSNRVAVVENALNRTSSAGTGGTLSAGGSLNEPRGLVVAPNGHILVMNLTDGIITEITPQGQQIAKVAAGQYRQNAWTLQTAPRRTYSEYASVQ